MTEILFILKRREDYSAKIHSEKGLSTGLFNSATFVCDMLNYEGIESALEVAIDNNCIDRLVTLHKPRVVIIEALWVVPSKFYELSKLHPGVTWVIRLHSDMPFMATEGISLDWIGNYAAHPNIVLAPNSPRMYDEVKIYLKAKHWEWTKEEIDNKIVYLPNFYPIETTQKKFNRDKHWIDIGCFGAVRPLKNHVMQAISSLQFAEDINKELRFHINIGRVEGRGEPTLHNLQGLFENLTHKGHKLIGHEWAPHNEFMNVCKKMDIGMQVSFSETFNIVGADMISSGVPFIGSRGEIPWGIKFFSADPQSSKSIIKALHRAYWLPELNVVWHRHNIHNYSNRTIKIWTKYFRG